MNGHHGIQGAAGYRFDGGLGLDALRWSNYIIICFDTDLPGLGRLMSDAVA